MLTLATGVYTSPSKAARRTRQRDLLQANIAEQHRLMIVAQQAEKAQRQSAAGPGGVEASMLQGGYPSLDDPFDEHEAPCCCS